MVNVCMQRDMIRLTAEVDGAADESFLDGREAPQATYGSFLA